MVLRGIITIFALRQRTAHAAFRRESNPPISKTVQQYTLFPYTRYLSNPSYYSESTNIRYSNFLFLKAPPNTSLPLQTLLQPARQHSPPTSLLPLEDCTGWTAAACIKILRVSVHRTIRKFTHPLGFLQTMPSRADTPYEYTENACLRKTSTRSFHGRIVRRLHLRSPLSLPRNQLLIVT